MEPPEEEPNPAPSNTSSPNSSPNKRKRGLYDSRKQLRKSGVKTETLIKAKQDVPMFIAPHVVRDLEQLRNKLPSKVREIFCSSPKSDSVFQKRVLSYFQCIVVEMDRFNESLLIANFLFLTCTDLALKRVPFSERCKQAKTKFAPHFVFPEIPFIGLGKGKVSQNGYSICNITTTTTFLGMGCSINTQNK